MKIARQLALHAKLQNLGEALRDVSGGRSLTAPEAFGALRRETVAAVPEGPVSADGGSGRGPHA